MSGSVPFTLDFSLIFGVSASTYNLLLGDTVASSDSLLEGVEIFSTDFELAFGAFINQNASLTDNAVSSGPFSAIAVNGTLADISFSSDAYSVVSGNAALADNPVSSDVYRVTAASLSLADTVVTSDQNDPPTLTNDGGVLIIAPNAGFPATASGTAGSFWSNGGVISVVPGGGTPNPAAPPVMLGAITPAALLALGGGNLPTSAPLNNNQLWNSGGEVWVASVLWPTDVTITSDSFAGVFAVATITLSDTLLTGDGVTAAPNFTATLTDSTVSSDLFYPPPVLNWVAGLTDTAVSSDVAAWTTVGLSLADSALSSDVLTPAPEAFTASLTDSAVSSAVQSGINILTFAETTATSDSLTAVFHAVTLALTDLAVSTTLTLSSGDAISDVGPLRIGFDPVGGIEGLAAFTLTDTAVSTDVFTYNGVLTLTDTAASSDAISLPASALSLADTVVSSDALTPTTSNYSSVVSDVVMSADLFSSTLYTLLLNDHGVSSDSLLPTGFGLLLAEATASSDAVSNLAGSATTTVSDVATSNDVFSTTSFAKQLSDTAVSSDSLSIASVSLLLGDTVVSGDTLTGGDNPAVSLGDSAVSSDTVVAIGFAISLSDTANSSDSLLPTGFGVLLADSVVSSDVPAGVATLAGTLSDTAVSAATFSFASASVVLAETTLTSDLLSPTETSLLVPLSDIVVTGEILTDVPGLPGSLSDSSVSSDALGWVKGFVASLLPDTAASSDSVTLTGYGYWYALRDTVLTSDALALSNVTYPPQVNATVVPTGGAVLLEFPSSFVTVPNPPPITILRSVAGSGVWTQIYQGPALGVFLDVGDSLPAPLDPGTAYLWEVVNTGGVTTVGPLTPASSFVNAPDQLTQILIRALQGALNCMTLPPGVQKPLITIRMPTNGWQAMPFIVVNVDLIQQTEVEIGEDVVNPDADNHWTLFANAKRVWRVTIMSQDAEERDFFRDSLLAVFRVLKATAFAPIGLDVSHTFQAVSYSSAQEWEGVTPGFYAADLMLEINGVFPAAVLTNYPTILQILPNPTWTLNTFSETLEPYP